MKAFAALLLIAAAASAAEYPRPIYKPDDYKPVYKPAEYKPAYKPEYKPDYKPDYKPEYKKEEYKHDEYKKEYPEYPPAHYEFKWESSAEPDTKYEHGEARKGDDTNGDFSSNGPTGSARVDYTVNGYSGFVAKSQFEIKGDSYGKPDDYKPTPKY